MDLSSPRYAAFRSRDFRLLVAARFLVVLGVSAQAVAIGWQLYDVTGSALALGLVGLVEIVPNVAVSLVSGYVADVADRRRVYVTALCGILAGSAYLVVDSLGRVAGGAGAGSLFPFFAVIALIGASRGFLMPAAQALVARSVPKADYANAAAWTGASFTAAAAGGPALGGLLYGFAGPAATYGVVALLIAAAAAVGYSLSPDLASSRPGRADSESVWQALTAGVRFVTSRQVLLGAMTLDMFAVLFGGATAVLPVFAKDVLGAGPETLGVLRAAPFLGSTLMSLYVARHPPVSATGRVLFVSVAGFGACIVGFALSTTVVPAFLFLFASGAFDSVSMVIRSSVVQLLTPDHMRGRVSAVNGIFIGSSNELGAFESGVAASLVGLVPSLVAGGVMTLAVTAACYKAFPGLVRFNIKDV